MKLIYTFYGALDQHIIDGYLIATVCLAITAPGGTQSAAPFS